MKTIEQRANNIIGQLEGIKKMINQPKVNCGQLIIQLKAVQAAMASLSEKIIAREFDRCLTDCSKSRQRDNLQKIFKEIVKK